MKNDEKDILSVTELAKLLAISRTHVLRKIKAGEIKASKVGNSYIVYKKDIPGIYREITNRDKKEIQEAVEKTFSDYEDVIKKLGKT